MTKPAIIEVIADSGIGGGPMHVARLVVGLNRTKNYEIFVICPEGWLTKRLENEARIISIPMPNVWNKYSQRKFIQTLETIQKNYSKILVHFHGVRAGIFGQFAISRIRKWKKPPFPIVYTEHLWNNDFYLKNKLRQWVQLKLLAKTNALANKTIAVSAAVKKFLLAQNLSSPQKIIVIHNGVEIPNRIHPPVRKNRLVVGSIGTMVYTKGFQDIVHILPAIVKQFPNLTLELIGDGGIRKRIEKMIIKLKLTNHVKLFGTVKNVQKVIQKWDVYVSASYSESFGLAVAQAMALGIPIVAYSVGGIPEIVDRNCGKLVNPGDKNELQHAIIDLLGQPKLIEKLGHQAAQKIRNKFTLELMIEKTIQVYNNLLEK